MKTCLDFEILIDDRLLDINPTFSLTPADNKNILTLLNDFEDNNWRYKKFQNFIWDNISETALSQQERECLFSQSHSLLTTAASNLRLTDASSDIGKGSELAEIVLYGIMKNHYKALPVVPKIFYKQNSQDNAKGADSVHIVVTDNENFTIWLGEAKFYSSIEDTRLASVIESIKKSLNTSKIKKENAIVTNIQDFDTLISSDALKTKIKATLSPKESIDTIKPILHIPILLLHQCSLTSKANQISEEYRNKIIAWHKDRAESFFTKQVKELSSIARYSDITFHLILFPVPNKDIIVDKFVSTVKFYKDQ
jgi:hypothetical protein